MEYVELVLLQLPTWPVVIIMLVGLCPVRFCLCLSARALCILLWPRTWLTCQLPTQKPASAFFLTACSLWGAFLVLLSGNPSSLQHSQLNWSSPSSEKTSSQGHHPCSHISASQELWARPHCLYSIHITILKLLNTLPCLSLPVRSYIPWDQRKMRWVSAAESHLH